MMEYVNPTQEQLQKWIGELDKKLGDWTGLCDVQEGVPPAARDALYVACDTLRTMRSLVAGGDLVAALRVYAQPILPVDTMSKELLDAMQEAEAESERAGAEPEANAGDKPCVLVRWPGQHYAGPVGCRHGETVGELVSQRDMPKGGRVYVNGKPVNCDRMLRVGPIGDIDQPGWPGDVVEIR